MYLSIVIVCHGALCDNLLIASALSYYTCMHPAEVKLKEGQLVRMVMACRMARTAFYSLLPPAVL